MTQQGSVLVVDGEPIDIMVTDAILSPHGFDVHGTTSGASALDNMERLRPDVVLLDVKVPQRDGLSLCRDIRVHPSLGLTPIIVLTALNDRQDRLRGLEAGADEFMSKPVDDVELIVRVRGLVERSRLHARLHTTESVVQSLAALVEARDDTTGDHCRRLIGLAGSFGESLGLDRLDLETLEWAAVLHDIGKVAVADAVLRKPGPLDEDEWEQMRSHVTVGSAIVSPLAGLDRVVPIIRHHHERWDGSGYPDSLQAEAIPYLARVFQIVDIFDALISDRPYKAAMTTREAVDVMRQEAGRTCDPELFRHFAMNWVPTVVPRLPNLEESSVAQSSTPATRWKDARGAR